MKWSPNQVVAFNLKRIREAKGMTQEAASEATAAYLPDGGFSPAVWSAAERSVTGKRVRQFDADELTGLAAGLGVPVMSLLIPPAQVETGITSICAHSAMRTIDLSEALTLTADLDESTRGRVTFLRDSLASQLDNGWETTSQADSSRVRALSALDHLRAAVDILSDI